MHTATMPPAICALLGGIVDYAGLFPPAKLSMEEAVSNFARYQTMGDAWMLGRFICPASRLSELDEHRDEFASRGIMRVSALLRGGRTHDEALETLRADCTDIGHFLATYGRRGSVDALEGKIPEEVLAKGSANAVAKYVHEAARVLEEFMPGPAAPFYEGAGGSEWRDIAGACTGGIAEATDRLAPVKIALPGFKLRCGGTEASAFPSEEQIAGVIAMCCSNRLAMKFTAGLHHPIRRFDDSVNTRMHGFLNVFIAGMMCFSRGIPHKELIGILECEDAAKFDISNSVSWREHRVPAEEIALLRQRSLVSFGSCSFDEPRADLRAIHLI